MTIEQVASVKKLFNRAIGRKVCFVVMPFKQGMRPVYDSIAMALREEQWAVTRADEIALPRRITDSIMEAISMSDLVVADITGNNPNVFYELGVAHAIGCDVILLTQDERIPFDISIEKAIIYKPHQRGREEMVKKLKHLAGSGRM
ncbi:MAG: hypothetical protein AB1631_30065 [Acidobacteriota bacterium]